MFDLLLDTFLKNIHFSPGNSWNNLPSILASVLLAASFVIFAGSALKDLQFNSPSVFLFNNTRPYKTPGPLEYVGVKELWNGKIVLIPGTAATKDHKPNTTENADGLRQQFYLVVTYSESRQAVNIISSCLESCPFVMKNKKTPIKILLDVHSPHEVRLLVTCYLAGVDSKEKIALTKSGIMLNIMNKLSTAAIKFRG